MPLFLSQHLSYHIHTWPHNIHKKEWTHGAAGHQGLCRHLLHFKKSTWQAKHTKSIHTHEEFLESDDCCCHLRGVTWQHKQCTANVAHTSSNTLSLCPKDSPPRLSHASRVLNAVESHGSRTVHVLSCGAETAASPPHCGAGVGQKPNPPWVSVGQKPA